MFSRFFSTSQPVHYLIGILLLSIGVLGFEYLTLGRLQMTDLVLITVLPLILLLVQFIIIKNELTTQNSFGLFITTMLLLTMVVIGVPWQSVIALLFLLLSLRRFISLKTGTDSIKKIFDGTFWISMAVLISPFLLIYYLVAFTAVFLFARNNWRHWAIPLVSIAAVALLGVTLELYTDYKFVSSIWSEEWLYINYLWNQWYPVTSILWILGAGGIMGVIIYIIKLVDIQQRVRPRFSVLVFFGICALILGLLVEGYFFLMLVPTLSIFLVRSVEVIKHKVVRELLFILPLLVLIMSLILV